MNRKIISLVLSLWMVMGPVLSSAAAPEEDPLEALHALCETLAAVKGEFIQIARSASSDRTVEERGWFAWERPDHLRWVYETPEKKDMIMKGNYLAFYVAADCVIYEDPDAASAQDNPLIEFIRSCVPDLDVVRLMDYRRIEGGERWIFEPRDAAADEVSWRRFIIEWYPPSSLRFESLDWLDNRVIYLMKWNPGTHPQPGDWDVSFPSDCERMPFGAS